MQKVSDEMTVGEAIDAGVGAAGTGLSARVNRSSFGGPLIRPGDLSEDANAIVGAIGNFGYVLLKIGMKKRGVKSNFLSIPKIIPSNHWIRAQIGDEMADRLQAELGGRNSSRGTQGFDMRKRGIYSRELRDDKILLECCLGSSAEQVANRYELTARQVRGICKKSGDKWGVDVRQERSLAA
ncbi:hypothetical protein [Burkholderia pseudomallei]